METKFHLRARALICRNGKVLAARADGKSHTSLPGGHVEDGEGILVALRREIIEECGVHIANERYLGITEQSWIEDNVIQWEIVHYFSAEIPYVSADNDIVSKEEKLSFLWIAPENFEKENLLPLPTRALITSYLAGDQQIWWASTF